jgi:hypothetical protein
MTEHPFNDSTPAERKAVMENDARVREQGGTFFSHTHLDDEAVGRFAGIKPRELVGSTLIPRYPGPGQCDPVPIEPALGIDVNAMPPCGEVFEVRRSLEAKRAEDVPPLERSPSQGASGGPTAASSNSSPFDVERIGPPSFKG